MCKGTCRVEQDPFDTGEPRTVPPPVLYLSLTAGNGKVFGLCFINVCAGLSVVDHITISVELSGRSIFRYLHDHVAEVLTPTEFLISLSRIEFLHFALECCVVDI
jgi:hypothetical protein